MAILVLRNRDMKLISFLTSLTVIAIKYIRGISGHSSIPPSVKLCSAFATSDLDKASLFNKYLYLIFYTQIL